MTEIIKKQDEIASSRKKFAEAVEKKDLHYAEITPDIQELELKGSVIKDPPKDLAELEQFREWVKRHKALKKRAEEFRKETTRPLDELISHFIEEHKQLFSTNDKYEAEITKQAMIYVTEEKKKEEEAKQKAEREKNKDIEIKSLGLKIENSAILCLTEEIASVRKSFNMSWASMTLEKFDERIAILKGYNPKVSFEKIISTYFNFNYQYITPDEFEGILKANFNFEDFTNKFTAAINEEKQRYIALAPEKKSQLQQQSEADRQKLITKAQDDEIQKGVQQALLKQKQEEQLKEKQADIVIDANSNVVEVKGTHIKNVRKNQIAYVNGVVDWNPIINLWISEFGSEKLQFLLQNLTKKGCPDMQGIAYKEDSKLIFK